MRILCVWNQPHLLPPPDLSVALCDRASAPCSSSTPLEGPHPPLGFFAGRRSSFRGLGDTWCQSRANPRLRSLFCQSLSACFGDPVNRPCWFLAVPCNGYKPRFPYFARTTTTPVEMLFGAPQGETATWLSLWGVLAVAVGIRAVLVGRKRSEFGPALTTKFGVGTLFSNPYR